MLSMGRGYFHFPINVVPFGERIATQLTEKE
jgi:hypothetical protein